MYNILPGALLILPSIRIYIPSMIIVVTCSRKICVKYFTVCVCVLLSYCMFGCHTNFYHFIQCIILLLYHLRVSEHLFMFCVAFLPK